LNYLWQEPHPATPEEIESLERQWGFDFPRNTGGSSVTVETDIYPIAASFSEFLDKLHD
jgi:hypothetical protein